MDVNEARAELKDTEALSIVIRVLQNVLDAVEAQQARIERIERVTEPMQPPMLKEMPSDE